MQAANGILRKSTPKLSICIPTFNRAALLEQQLHSVALSLESSSRPNVEVCISDNASTDDTQQVVDSYRTKMHIAYSRNETNIGGARNILSLPFKANGEFLWIIGDDDLLYPEAIQTVLARIDQNPEFDAHVVSHAIAPETDRDELFASVVAARTPQVNVTLFPPELCIDKVDAFESVFQLTDMAAPLNFVSNVILRRRIWVERGQRYLDHCNSRGDLADTITACPHLCLYIETLSGRPVGLLAKPMVIGFVGSQTFVSRWELVLFTHFLSLGRVLRELGGNPVHISKYESNILLQAESLFRLISSDEAQVKREFSLFRLIRNFGDSRSLWSSLDKCLNLVSSRGRRFQLLLNILIYSSVSPKSWPQAIRFIRRQFLSRFTHIRNWRERYSARLYSRRRKKDDSAAACYFNTAIHPQSPARVQDPVHLINPQYITIGSGFSAGPGLRIEAWDDFAGKRYTPRITIGNEVILNFNCHIGAIDSITIGDGVLIGSNVLITDHQHGNPRSLVPNSPYAKQPLWSKGPVVIEDNVWLGENVAILPGVTIGANSIVGANSVVCHDVPRDTIVVGAPARVLTTIQRQET